MNLGLEKFAGGCAAVCTEAHPDADALLMTTEEDGSILVGEVIGSDADTLNLVAAEMFIGHRTYAALATRAMWSPDDGPSSDSWTLVTVDDTDTQAVIRVKRLVEDDHWWKIEPKDAPWFALSTAGGLRRALNGESLVVKAAGPRSDPRLMRKLTDGPGPRTDREGRI